VPESPTSTKLFTELAGLCRYYGRVLVRATIETWECFEVSLRTLLIGIALYLLTVLITALAVSAESVVSERFPALLVWAAAGLLFILFLFVVNLVRAPYLIHEDLFTENSTLTTKNKQLTEQFRTQLDIKFDEKRGDFVDSVAVVWNGQSTMCKLYRVAVTHHSKSTVAELKAEQVTLTTGRTHPPLHLRITGKHDPPEQELRLHAGTPGFWDVVQKPDYERGWVALMHAEKERGILLQLPCSFRITASCDEGFPITKLVTLGLKENNDLDFQLTDV
jgi:hypothetical protein